MDGMIIGLIGLRVDDPRVNDALGQYGTLKAYTSKDLYVPQLVDDHTALVLIDMNSDASWRYWVTAPKINPATRRIPVIVVIDVPEQASEVLLAGADDYVLRADLETQLTDMFTRSARILEPEVREQLDCECEEILPALAVEGLEKFNAGEYYRQHDLFEALWVETGGPVRDLYRAVLQVGVAYYQIQRGNRRGALKMLLRSRQWLNILPDVCQGIDVEQLRKDSARVRAELERLSDEDIEHFDRNLLKPVQRIENA